jgi:hypothetical protein
MAAPERGSFRAEQVGTWNVAPREGSAAFVGVWIARPVGEEGDEGIALVLQPDGFAFFSVNNSRFYRGSWRVEGARAQIRFPSARGEGSEFGGLDLDADLAGGGFAFTQDGRTFQAVKQ